MSAPPAPVTVPRVAGLDAFRGVAVLLMFAVHVQRLLASRASTGLDAAVASVFDALAWAEPLIAASFLTVVGTSLVLSRQRSRGSRPWLRRLATRAMALYLTAVLLFVPQFGVVLPDLLLSPGILSVIGVALLVTGGALLSARPAAVLVAIALVALFGELALEATARCVVGLNAGPGGTLPLVGFAAVGALGGRALLGAERRALGVTLGLSAAALVAALASGAAWTTRCTSLYPAHASLIAVENLLGPPGELGAIPFWNHTGAGFVGLAGLCTAALAFTVRLPWPARGLLAGGGLVGLVGRHALAAYVGHLLVLGGLELCDITPTTPPAAAALVGVLFAAAAAASALRERSVTRRRAPPAPT